MLADQPEFFRACSVRGTQRHGTMWKTFSTPGGKHAPRSSIFVRRTHFGHERVSPFCYQSFITCVDKPSHGRHTVNDLLGHIIACIIDIFVGHARPALQKRLKTGSKCGRGTKSPYVFYTIGRTSMCTRFCTHDQGSRDLALPMHCIGTLETFVRQAEGAGVGRVAALLFEKDKDSGQDDDGGCDMQGGRGRKRRLYHCVEAECDDTAILFRTIPSMTTSPRTSHEYIYV